jgi:hypothetical protein
MIPFVSIAACVLVFLLAILVKNGSLAGRRFNKLQPTQLRMSAPRGVATVVFVVLAMAALVVGWKLYYSSVSSNLISDEPRASQ